MYRNVGQAWLSNFPASTSLETTSFSWDRVGNRSVKWKGERRNGVTLKKGKGLKCLLGLSLRSSNCRSHGRRPLSWPQHRSLSAAVSLGSNHNHLLSFVNECYFFLRKIYVKPAAHISDMQSDEFWHVYTGDAITTVQIASIVTTPKSFLMPFFSFLML